MKTKSQLGRMSKNKGAQFERKVANILKSRGFLARRAVQFDGILEHDLKVDIPFNFECKAVERLDLYSAYAQAVGDSEKSETTPVVIHKKNNHVPLVSLALTDFIDILQWALGYVDEYNALYLKEYRTKYKKKMAKEKELEGLL